jgi:hypothetical protein
MVGAPEITGAAKPVLTPIHASVFEMVVAVRVDPNRTIIP